MRRSTLLGLAAGMIAILVAPGMAAPRQASDPAQDWLGWVNHYRALGGMPSVVEDPALSDGAAKHARYMAETGDFTHFEDPNSPWYTPEGDEAGRSSELTRGPADRTPRSMLETWASEIFHGTWLVDPRLKRVGFATDRGYGVFDDGHLDPQPEPVGYPIVWPGDGKALSITTMGNESPDPETTCPGAAGAAIKVAFPDTPQITSTSLTSEGQAVDHCSFDETSYTNPDPGSQSVGRLILESVHMVAIIPTSPLVAGRDYQVTVTNATQPTSWSFSVVDPSSVPAPVVPTPPPTVTPSAVASPSPSATPTPTTSGSVPTIGTTSVSLSPSSTRIKYGRTLRLIGRVDRQGCSDDLRIQVARRVHGINSYEVVDDIDMIGPGAFEVSFPADFTATYVAQVTTRSGGCSASSSSPREVRVHARIRAEGITSCSTTPTISGKVLPKYPGTRVNLKNRRNRVVDRDRLDGRSRFSLRAPSCGKTYRVVWPAQSAGNSQGSKIVRG